MIMNRSLFGAIVVGALAVSLTVAYWIVAWYLSAIWATLVVDQEAISRLSAYTIKPLSYSAEYAMLHWQSLALGSLIINMVWGLKRFSGTRDTNNLVLPFCCHLGWLVLAVFLHIAGGLASFVMIAYQLN